MFPRRLRLAKTDFSPALLAHSRRFSSAHLSLLVPEEGARGYAVIISKKTARLSVTRHRLKRRVLAAMRAYPLPPALIVFPKLSVLKLSSAELKGELGSLLSKIK